MPASGFIKVKQWNDTPYAAGALTGIGASATGADTVGFIELVGDESNPCTVPRLGLFEMLGEWYVLGNTSGVANQQFQVPTNGSTVYVPGIYIETSVGSDLYEFYPNAGSQTTIAADIRAKVCWISTAGLIRIGNNGTANAGYTPVSGLKVRIPNILTQNCTTAARTANVLPNTALATRYDFTTTGGGVINIDKAMLAWYLSFTQAYSVNLAYCATLDSMAVSEIAAPMTWVGVGIGQTAAQTQNALNLSLCFAGGTFNRCHWTRATLPANGNYAVVISDINGFTFIDERSTCLTLKGQAATGNYSITRAVNCNWNSTNLINGRIALLTCSACSFINTKYADVITGTTATTTAQQSYTFDLSASCKDITISGVDFFNLTNVQPYLGILNIAAAGCLNIKLRNIGTNPSSTLSLGSVNQSAYLFNLATAAAASNIKIQRCFVSGTRVGLWTADNSSTGLTIENVMGDYADAPVSATLNTIHKSVGATHALTAQTSVYGTHFIDYYTSATVGRLGILMNETTSLTSSQVTLANGAAFTSAGGLYMPVIGHQAIFEMPYYALGHSSFTNSALIMAGGTATNYTYQYQIDLNNGAGFSAWSSDKTATTLGTALNAEIISPSLGFKLKLKITTSTTNATAITSVYMATVTSAANQANYHPLDQTSITLSANASLLGSEIRIYDLDGIPVGSLGTELSGIESATGTTYSFTATPGNSVWIQIMANGYKEYGQAYTIPEIDNTLSIFLTADLNT
jgi:hypothetical protein